MNIFKTLSGRNKPGRPDDEYQFNILQAMSDPITVVNRGGLLKHVYGGTVDPAVIAKRRAANKVARRSRRINRLARR